MGGTLFSGGSSLSRFVRFRSVIIQKYIFPILGDHNSERLLRYFEGSFFREKKATGFMSILEVIHKKIEMYH